MSADLRRASRYFLFFLVVAALGCSDSDTTSNTDLGVDADVDSGATDVDADVDGTVVDPDASTADADVDAGPSCQGTATDCSTLGSIACLGQMGCSAGTFSCAGTPDACSTYTTVGTCAAASALGCAWQGGMGGGSCAGTPTACDTRIEATCVDGCVPSGACTGTATPCAGLAVNECIAQDGCSWQ